MPSDFEPIAGCKCTGCGRESEHVALKRLNTYSRAFSCLTCYVRFSSCANCHHERHSSDRSVAQRIQDVGGRCFCGCTDYVHGLEREFDRQFSEHTGKAAAQLKCLHCGNYFSPLDTSRLCPTCDQEWKGIQNV